MTILTKTLRVTANSGRHQPPREEELEKLREEVQETKGQIPCVCSQKCRQTSGKRSAREKPRASGKTAGEKTVIIFPAGRDG